MKAFANVNARDLPHAVKVLADTRSSGRSAVVAGGGSDLLGLIKEQLVTPDVLVNLKTIGGMDRITVSGEGARIGGLVTLDALSRHAVMRERYDVLAEAAGSAATPQIRAVATVAGNVCQRPWCWYYRNRFPCLKNGGDRCFAIDGENQFHAIFGGGPSYIVHPSDTAPALVALDARFRIVGPAGERVVPAAEFFVLPRKDPTRENSLAADEVLAEIVLPPAVASIRSTYNKVLDREAWTHAIVSAAVALDVDARGICRTARVVLGGVAPIPWRVPAVEALLIGERMTPALAAKAGAAAVTGAQPLEKNAYKVPMTSALVRRTLLALVGD